MVGDVLLSCSMSSFHHQLSMYNNRVPREQCVAEIVSDHVDHIHFRRAATGADGFAQGQLASRREARRSVSTLRSPQILRRARIPRLLPIPFIFVINIYNVINLILFSLSGQFVREKELKCLRYTPIGTY